MQFIFENQRLDLDRRELRRGTEMVPVEPQVFDLLVYLISNRDRVVSKDDLIAAVWAGRIVSDSTLTSRINAARKAIGDSGARQALIRTVPRKGLRFVSEVQEERTTAGEANGIASDAPPQMISDRPSIAVLPFQNLSEDHTLGLIVSGLAEDIIALLARVPGFFVIARASSFAYLQPQADVRRIGTELGVRYIVTGSARSSGERVRVAVQLIEAENGNQLWAGRYDVERGDTLDLQDEIVRQIVVELEPAVTKADLSLIQRQRVQNLDAWAHFRRGRGAIAVLGWNEQTVAEGTAALQQAIAIDPEFALARALFALMRGFGALLSLVDDIPVAVEDARREAERSVVIDPNASEVLGYAGCALADVGEDERGLQLLQRALELDPSNAQAHVAMGAALARLGRLDEAIERLQYGLRSSPKDFRLPLWTTILAFTLGRAGRLDEALEVSSSAARRDGRLYGARVVSAWTLQKLDRVDEARAALAEARRIRPHLSAQEIQRFFGKSAASEIERLWN